MNSGILKVIGLIAFVVAFVAIIGHLLYLRNILFFGLVILGTVFWIWMLVDCATNEGSEGNDKLVWVIIIVFTHFIGALIYYFVRRPKRKSELGR